MNEPNIVIVCEPLLGEKDCNLHSLTKQYSFETKLYVKVLLFDVYSILTIASQHQNKCH